MSVMKVGDHPRRFEHVDVEDLHPWILLEVEFCWASELGRSLQTGDRRFSVIFILHRLA